MSIFRTLRRFGGAPKGLAALEFAIIAPMMIFALFGSVELLDLLGANKRAQNVAASLADVVARDTSVSNTEITGLWSAADVLMFPDTAAGMQARVTSVSIVSASSAKVVWSVGHGGMTPLVNNAAVTLPSGMMIPGSSIIMTEVSYPYTPPLHFLIAGSMNLDFTAYRRSRLVDPIPCTWTGCP